MRKKWVFLLGAGASYGMGFPRAFDLFERDFICSVREVFTQSAPSAAFEKLLESADFFASHRHDLQDLYDNWLRSDNNAEIQRFEDLVDTVMFMAESASFQPRRGFKVAPIESIFSFIALIRTLMDYDFSISIVSLNYDLMIEHALGWTGFNYGEAASKMHWPQIPFPMLNGSLPDFTKSLMILKPHGSMNWLICNKCGLVICGVDNLWQLRRTFPFICVCEKCGGKTDRLLVPPVKIRRSSFFDPIWGDIGSVLEEATGLFVVGYSFPEYDAYIADRIRDRLNPNAEIAIIDPNFAQQLERYRAVFGNRSLVATDMGFTDLMIHIVRNGGPTALLNVLRPVA